MLESGIALQEAMQGYDRGINESALEARPNHGKLLDLLDGGAIEYKFVAENLMKWLPDDELGEFMNLYGLDVTDDFEESINKAVSEAWFYTAGDEEYEKYKDDCTSNFSLPSDVERYLAKYYPECSYGKLPSGDVFWKVKGHVIYFNDETEFISEMRHDIMVRGAIGEGYLQEGTVNESLNKSIKRKPAERKIK